VSGFEVAIRLRKHFGDGVVLIALLGLGRGQDIQSTREAGFDLHFIKPADPLTIIRTASGDNGNVVPIRQRLPQI
jgi:CheY-like chemotaxis protein